MKLECKKTSFETKEDAEKKLNEIKSLNNREKIPTRSYKCVSCGYYHLTSWSNKKQKDFKRIKSISTKNRRLSQIEVFFKRKGWDLNYI